MRRRVRSAALVAALLPLLGGCVADQQRLLTDLSEQAPTAAAALSQHLTPRWAKEFRSAGTPAVAGDVVVAYEAPREGHLDAVGLSARDGTELWRYPAATGPIGEQDRLTMQLTRLGERTVAVFLTAGTPDGVPETGADGKPRYAVAAVDAVTGQEVIEDPQPVSVRSAIEPCRLGAGLCFTVGVDAGTDGATDPTKVVRLNLETRRAVDYRFPLDAAPGQVTDLGEHLYAAVGTDSTELGRTDPDGQVLWRADSTELVGTGFDPARQWYFLHVDTDNDQVHLSVRTKPGTDAETGFGVAEVNSVLLRLSDGEVLYQQQGASFDCPGSRMLLCTGGLTYTRDAGGAYVPGGDVRMLGLEPATGQPVWEQQIAGAEVVTNRDYQVLTPARNWLWRSAGKTWFNDGTGRQENLELDDDAWIACRTERGFRPQATAEAPGPEYRADVFLPCSVTGAHSGQPAQFTIAGVLAVGITEYRTAPEPGEAAEHPQERLPGYYVVPMWDHLAVFQ